MRNPLIVLDDGTSIQTIGDLHLGRRFINGVPLEKRGQMEALVTSKFEELLAVDDVDIVVQMGDVFDKFQVDESVILYAANAFISAATDHPKIQYFVLRGNHDESKDITKVSSFAVFAEMLALADLDNLTVVKGTQCYKNLVFFGWSPENSAKEIAELWCSYMCDLQKPEAFGPEYRAEAAFGHWDVNLPPMANHFNYIPIEQLKTQVRKIVTGHDHKPAEEERDGVEIVRTGSILPLAHGEEIPEDKLIYTIKPDEYDPKEHDGKIVRFILKEDEEIPDGDFLQVKAIQKPTTENEEEPDTDTDSFDLEEILSGFLKESGIDEDTAAEVVERFSSRNAE